MEVLSVSGDHTCDKGEVFALMADGQKAIFVKLDIMSKSLESVAVQKNEIEHINKELANLREVYNADPTTLCSQIVNDISRASALFLFCVLAYTLFNNVPGYVNRVNAVKTAPEKSK